MIVQLEPGSALCLTAAPAEGYDSAMNSRDLFSEIPPGASKIHYYPTLGSTNVELHRLAGEEAPDGTVILADTQSAGRGRRGRLWHSPPGKGIYFSVLLRPPRLAPAGAAPVTLVAAVAAARGLREAAGLAVAVKWPNDLLVGPRKLGGILTEARAEGDRLLYLVLGIGLNVNHRSDDFPADLRIRATSLALECNRTFRRVPLFLALLEGVLRDCRLFFESGFAPFQQPWKEISATLGKMVQVDRTEGTLRGKAVAIDPAGALLVEDSRGKLHRIFCGEII